MKKVINWFTDTKMFIVGAVGLVVYFISYYNREIGLPSSYDDFCCIDDRRFNLFALLIPFFIFSVVFLLSRNRSFVTWRRFTGIYVFFYTLIYFIVPTHGDGLLWFQRETISFLGVIMYSIISFYIILPKAFSGMNKETNQN